MNRALKSSLRPVRNLAITITGNVLACATLFYFVERNQQVRVRSLDLDYMGSLYWAVTTATTTGYGDYSPITTAGRLIGMWLMLTSVGLVAVATAQIAGAIISNPHIFTNEEQEELKDDSEDTLALAILIANKLNIEIPSSVEETEEVLSHYNKKGTE